MNPWNHNIHYHDWVLSRVPVGCGRALDVGCGTGLLLRKLAGRCREAVGIECDRAACQRARAIEGDVMTYPFEPGGFDFIAAVAVLHHLPLRPALERFRDLLAPGGVLAVIGLYRRQSIMDWAADIVALPVSRALRITRECSEVDAPLRDPQESLGEIRAACNAVLPGAKVERRLLFRYSLYWRKPDEA